jgi:hypothetical protein
MCGGIDRVAPGFFVAALAAAALDAGLLTSFSTTW